MILQFIFLSFVMAINFTPRQASPTITSFFQRAFLDVSTLIDSYYSTQPKWALCFQAFSMMAITFMRSLHLAVLLTLMIFNELVVLRRGGVKGLIGHPFSPRRPVSKSRKVTSTPPLTPKAPLTPKVKLPEEKAQKDEDPLVIVGAASPILNHLYSSYRSPLPAASAKAQEPELVGVVSPPISNGSKSLLPEEDPRAQKETSLSLPTPLKVDVVSTPTVVGAPPSPPLEIIDSSDATMGATSLESNPLKVDSKASEDVETKLEDVKNAKTTIEDKADDEDKSISTNPIAEKKGEEFPLVAPSAIEKEALEEKAEPTEDDQSLKETTSAMSEKVNLPTPPETPKESRSMESTTRGEDSSRTGRRSMASSTHSIDSLVKPSRTLSTIARKLTHRSSPGSSDSDTSDEKDRKKHKMAIFGTHRTGEARGTRTFKKLKEKFKDLGARKEE